MSGTENTTIETGETPANRTAQAYQAAASVLAGALEFQQPAVALSQDIKLHNIEHLLPHAARQKGSLVTASIDDFGNFVKSNVTSDSGAESALLVDEETLCATAILDFGNRQKPGHKQMRAELNLKRTDQLKAFENLQDRAELRQRDLAEFIEDHFGHCEFYRESGDALDVIDTKAALKAIGSVDAERIKRSNSTIAPLSASASTFEQITISDATASLPTRMVFSCAWCYGLPEVHISCRVRVLTNDSNSKVTFRIDPIDISAAKRESAQALQKILRQLFAEQAIETYLGQFNA